MRPIRSLLIYTAAVFLGAALIAPRVYWMAGFIESSFGFSNSPFHRVFSRCLLTLAIIGIWPLLRSLGIKSWRDVGMVKSGRMWQRLLAGFAFGFGSLLCVALICLAAHGWRFRTDVTSGQFLRGVAAAAASAIFVSVVEELLFRGTIFGTLRKTMDWRIALVLSSLIYAILHFITRADLPGPVTWRSGFEFLPLMFGDVGKLHVFIPAFLSLTLVGLMLGLAYQRTGNLYFSIGLHAGWIFWPQTYGLFLPTVGGGNSWFWGTSKLLDGWLTFIMLAFAWIVVSAMFPRTRTEDLG